MRVSALCALLIPIAACTLPSQQGDDGSRVTKAQLPDGVTLLQSGQDQCNGTVRVDAGLIAGRNSHEVVLGRGQDAAFEIEEARVVWSCVSNSTTTEDSLDCPVRTSFVRITRPSDGETFLVECFG